jgi:hypothetical protein
MNTYTDRPWLALYPAGSPTDITTEFDSALAMFEASCETAPDAPLIRYFDATLTLHDVDNAATALASTLVCAGFGPGDRLALFTQNDPAYVIGMIGAWKAGGTAVAVNPMSRARELTHLLADSGAVAMVVLDDLYEEVAREVIATVPTDIRTVITTSARDLQTRNDPRLFRGTRRPHPDGTLDLREVIADNAGRTLPSPGLSAADPRGADLHLRHDGKAEGRGQLAPQPGLQRSGVLDCELSTIGDPLADLGLLLFYWAQKGEPAIPLVPNITSSDGFQPRSYLLARYAQRTGIDVSTVPFYEAFARFKFAVIIQGVTKRSALGMMAGQDVGNVDAEVVRLAGAGLDALEVA